MFSIQLTLNNARNAKINYKCEHFIEVIFAG